MKLKKGSLWVANNKSSICYGDVFELRKGTEVTTKWVLANLNETEPELCNYGAADTKKGCFEYGCYSLDPFEGELTDKQRSRSHHHHLKELTRSDREFTTVEKFITEHIPELLEEYVESRLKYRVDDLLSTVKDVEKELKHQNSAATLETEDVHPGYFVRHDMDRIILLTGKDAAGNWAFLESPDGEPWIVNGSTGRKSFEVLSKMDMESLFKRLRGEFND